MENRELNLLGAEVMAYTTVVYVWEDVIAARESGAPRPFLYDPSGNDLDKREGLFLLVGFDTWGEPDEVPWNPCEDLNQAVKVAGELGTYRIEKEKGGWACVTIWHNYQAHHGRAETEPLAIMRAVAEARAETPQSLKEREGAAD
jgi:hypothetical protein